MKNLPNHWKLVEFYEGNYIFEDEEQRFQISIDKMGQLVPPYEINFHRLQGTFNKIGNESGAYSTHAFTEIEALGKAVEMMKFIDSKKL